ncbi:MAG TPA: hypothetical protein VNM91_05585, partial [Dehalococcoidia bacterium]|nr:hypothetical protein [Dehalococcoidia bacterium]
MPRQNRPVVRDGRLQPKRKRTDRSYLRTASQTDVSPELAERPLAAEDVAIADEAAAETPVAPP